jgi:hypothetical protein
MRYAAGTVMMFPPNRTVSGLYRTNFTDLPPIAPTISLMRAHSHDSSYSRCWFSVFNRCPQTKIFQAP